MKYLGRAQTPKMKGCHPVSCRTRLTTGTFLSFLFFWGVLAGCNEYKTSRIHIVHFDQASFHNLLTLFFDGVPPLEDEMIEVGPVHTEPNAPDMRKLPEVNWCTHAPLKDCVRCHGNRQQESFSREVQLTARVPALCYACHTALMPTSLKGWVHGPVAVGQCLVCHEPHKTKYQHLLREQIPALCYSCHLEMDSESTPDNVKKSHSQCNDCHSGHTGLTNYTSSRMPELCCRCHESFDRAALRGYVHGPVAVGQCIICHDFHKNENQDLLRKGIPALCYACHGEASMKSINDHWRKSYADCSNCHEAHTSPERYLLKPGRQQRDDEVEVPGSVFELSGQ